MLDTPKKKKETPVTKSASGSWLPQTLPFERLHREINRLFENFGHSDWFPSTRGESRFELGWPGGSDWSLAPAMDISETDDEYVITAELPGMDEKDVDVQLANGTLTVSGEKSDVQEDKRKDYYLSERRYGSIQRSIRLPEGVDSDAIEASFAKGVLTLKLPKTPESRQAQKKIAVKAA